MTVVRTRGKHSHDDRSPSVSAIAEHTGMSEPAARPDRGPGGV